MDHNELKEAMKNLYSTINETISAIDGIKSQIEEYFSDAVQMDETPGGALKRNQLRKALLDFSRSPTDWKFLIGILNIH
jgi:regulator of replication initiation timing